jgi:manganese/iron transport system ATP-binding protein
VNGSPARGAALVLDDVTVAYGREPVVEGISGRVEPGASLALIGPNGAGKTTLIRAVLGLAPVVRGTVTVLGRRPADARGDVAYVPQAEALDPEFPVSVLQVVLMGRYRRVGWVRRPSARDRAVARAALAEVGLEERAGDRFGLLSGGQRQRVLLARAIAQEAALLLLDEPFNGVDTTNQAVLLDVLAHLRSRGTAVVMSTHDLAVAHLACGEACLLNHHQVAFGPLHQTLTPELLRATYGPGAVTLAAATTLVTAPGTHDA